ISSTEGHGFPARNGARRSGSHGIALPPVIRPCASIGSSRAGQVSKTRPMRRHVPACWTPAIALTLALAGASPVAPTEFPIHGILVLVAAGPGEAYDLNVLTRGDSPFDAFGVRLFLDTQVSDRLAIFPQVVLRDATSPYVDGAYLNFTPSLTRDMHVLAGKI